MRITYIDHARDRMKERHITDADVELTITDCDHHHVQANGRTKYTREILGQQTPVTVIAVVKRLTIDHYIVYTVY